MFQLYCVGGFVRDYLRGTPATDIDYIVVGATPQQMLDCGLNQVGADFPVFLDSKGNEYALARTERKQGHGYHGFDVRFDDTITLEQDLLRRDLTINAMAMPVDFETFGDPTTYHIHYDNIIDPYNGKQDLNDGILRHVSSAFSDDPVRSLRVARFVCRFKGYQIAPETAQLMEQMGKDGEYAHLTPERINTEMQRAIMHSDPMTFFSVLDDCNILRLIFTHLPENFKYRFTSNTPRISNTVLLAFMGIPEAQMRALHASREQSAFLQKWSRIQHKLTTKHDGRNMGGSIVCMYNIMDAFRNTQHKQYLQTLCALEYEKSCNVSYGMLSCVPLIDMICDIGFADLSEEQQNFKGQDISNAITQFRVKVANDNLHMLTHQNMLIPINKTETAQ